MNWSQLITSIANGALGERYSDSDLANITGIARENVYKLKTGATTKPQQSTIDKLEKGLRIKIDDRDIENITYVKLPPEDDSETKTNIEKPHISIPSGIGQRIIEIRKKLKLSKEQLADYLGLDSIAQINHWESNQEIPQAGILVKIASLGKVTLDWLLTGIESTFEPPRTDLSTVYGDAHKVDLDMYPLVEKVTAGNYQLITTQENIIEYFPLPVKRKYSFLVEVEGDSMISSDPTKSIVPGDLLLIDTIEIAMPGDIVVVLLNNDRQMVKQLFHKNGTFEFRSLNPNYPPIYATEEEVVCIYRVVYHQPKGRKL